MTLTIEHGATGSLSTLKKTHKSTNPNGNSNSNHGDDDNDDDNNNQVRSSLHRDVDSAGRSFTILSS